MIRISERTQINTDFIDNVSQSSAFAVIVLHMLNRSVKIGCSHEVDSVFRVSITMRTPVNDLVNIHALAVA